MSTSTTHTFQEIKDAIVETCSLGDYARVDALVRQARSLAASRDPAAVAEAHWCEGLALLHRQSKAALSHFDVAHAFYRDDPVMAARVQVNRGFLLARIGRVDEGAAALAEAEATLRAVGQIERLPSLLINRSDLEGRAGRYEEMLHYARETEVVALSCDYQDAVVMGRINQAYAAMLLGDFALAAEALGLARSLADAEGYDDLAARVAVNQAHLCIAQDQLMQALRLLGEARSRFPPDLAVEEATVAVEEAALYERLGMYEEGYRAVRTAARLFELHDLPEESADAALLGLRLALTAERSLPPWIFDPQRWIVRDREVLRAHAARLADRISPTLRAMLAALEAHPGLPPSADRAALLAQADAAASALAPLGAFDASLRAGLIAADLAAAMRLDATTRYKTIAARAAAQGLPGLEQQAWEGLAAASRGRAATAALQRAADLAAAMCRTMPDEELKARALTSQSLLHTRLVAAYLREGKPGPALDALLLAKGGLWSELVAARQVEPPDPAWLAARAALVFWESRLAEAASDGEDRAICQGHIRRALLTLRAVRRERAPLPTPSIAAIQARIPEGSVAIEYMLGERHAMACVLSRTGPPRWLSLGKTRAIRDAAERLGLRLRPLMRLPPDVQRVRATAQRQATDRIFAELYDLLVAPLAPELAGAPLIIAPDSALGDLPWAALYDRGSPAAPYLGERHTLSLVPSLAVIALDRPPAPSSPPMALGCADEAIAPQVAAELEAFATLFSGARVRYPAASDLLTGAAGPEVLHISAHGELNAQQPLLSALILADGPFLLADVFNLNLAGTTLAVLSACETNAIAPLGGVALALSGSFLAAGAEAVLAGLWRIDAESARIFVEACYSALLGGVPLETAVQRAQAAVRAAGYDHPYYWAALQPLMGTPNLRLPVRR